MNTETKEEVIEAADLAKQIANMLFADGKDIGTSLLALDVLIKSIAAASTKEETKEEKDNPFHVLCGEDIATYKKLTNEIMDFITGRDDISPQISRYAINTLHEIINSTYNSKTRKFDKPFS